jgi:hypothetical protein
MLELIVFQALSQPKSLPIPSQAPLKQQSAICRKLPLSQLVQNGSNCGPTSLRMIFNTLGKNYNQQHVVHITFYSKILGTSPFHLKRATESVGLRASIRNYSTSQTVISVIDSGGYAMAIVSAGSSLHYVVINGYRKSNPGKIEFLITDPNGTQSFVPLAKFDRKWSNPKLHGIDTGFRRCVIAIGKQKLICERISGNAARNSFLHARLNEASKSVSDLAFSVTWFFKAASNLVFNSNNNTSDDKSIAQSYRELPI